MRAHKNEEIKNSNNDFYLVRHCLLIECKKTSEKPWVIMTSNKNFYDHILNRHWTRGFADSANWWQPWSLNPCEKIHPYSEYKRRGRSFFIPFNKGNKEGGREIYQALATSVKAAIFSRDNGFGSSFNDICFFYPLVVFEGNLYESLLRRR